MTTIAILDTETSGLDPKRDELLEVAVATFDLDLGAMVEMHSYLLFAEKNAAEAINGIAPELLKRHGRHFDCDRDLHAAQDIARVLLRADAVVAWNAAFDRPWIEGMLTRLDVLGPHTLKWACAMDDMEWPRSSTSKSLVAMALAHGVGVVDAHRATSDVLTLARMFQRAQELGADLPDMLARALRPRCEYRAAVSYDQRDLAKRAGFRWDADRKSWFKRLVVGEVPELPFAVERVS